MANLSITNVCNKKCTYCFANDTRNEFSKTYIDDDTFDMALDYLERSGIKQARLLGGEPTLHPNFKNFVEKTLERHMKIMLFTNGLISDEILEFLALIPKDRLSILLNTIHPIENNAKGMNRQKEVMEVLGPMIIAGVNIFHSKQDLDYILDYVTSYNLKKEVRMGISHPVLSLNNVYLHPKEYQKIGRNIAMLKLKAKKINVAFGFDCGFVPCMFPVEYFDILSEELKKAGTCCHPIIDMLADGSFIACYPLNNLLKIKIHDQLNARELIKSFEEVLAPYKGVGIYPYCSSCPLFNKRCNGGCMSFRIQRFANNYSFV